MVSTLSAMLFTGCGLIPKRVEFFQKKVEAVPEKTPKAKELEKQVAKRIAQDVDQALEAAKAEHSSTNVINPLESADTLAPALSSSLGQPKEPYTGKAEPLAQKINKEEAKLDQELEEYREDNRALEGKKIEGTGKISMPWIVYVALVVGGLAFLWFVIKIGIAVASNMYPGVGVGLNMLKVPGRQAAKSLSEVLEGGEHFKELVKTASELEDDIKDQVLALFKRAQVEKQSRDVQKVIKNITSK